MASKDYKTVELAQKAPEMAQSAEMEKMDFKDIALKEDAV
jgi:hypothetical protein